MTATTVPTSPAPPAPARLMSASVSGRRRLKNTIAMGLIYSAVVIAAIPLGLLVFYVVNKGLGAMSWSFLTDPIPTTRSIGPGVGPAVVGTLLTTAVATVLAVPLGVMGAVYLNEYGKTNPYEDFATSLEVYFSKTKPVSQWQVKWSYMDRFLNDMSA